MHKRNTLSPGFTIVELLIVIVVIAILAAISIVAYRGIQDRANNTIVESDIAQMTKMMELAKVDLGHYPRSFSEFPPNFKFSKGSYGTTGNNVYYCIDITNDRYAFGLRSTSSKAYLVNTGTVSTPASVDYTQTCNAIGKSVVIDATTWYTAGYSVSSSTWNSSWSWAN